ncbi:MAG TPA: hypothetical protein VGN09_06495 [Vicinamibacteria bacterium]
MEILRAYPYLEAADIDEALRYAASLAEDDHRVGRVKFLVDMPVTLEAANHLGRTA